MIYAVIDTNVIVSALLTRSEDAATVKVLDAIFQGKIIPLYNGEIIMEYSEVLCRAKFHFPPAQVQMFVDGFVQMGIDAQRVHVDEVFPDPDDIVFFEVALSKEGAYLVTGNKKHFPSKPIVVTPAEMMAIIEAL